MLRINLLPPEVLERRRYERWYRPVFFVGAAVLLAVLLVWALFFFQEQQRTDELQQAQESVQQFQTQADAFGVFERREQDYVQREAVAKAALTGRINMGALAEDISLVLPDEVWLESMSLSEATDGGMRLIGQTPRSTSQSMNISYKSLARMLVRLNQLPLLYDVWLNKAGNTVFDQWQSKDAQPLSAPTVPVVEFESVARLRTQAATATSTPAPAPPSSQSE